MTSHNPMPLEGVPAPILPDSHERELVRSLCGTHAEGRRGMAFPEPLESRYLEENRETRTRAFVVSGIIAFVMYASYLINDAFYRPGDLALAAMLRLGGVCLVAALVLPLVKHVRSLWWKECLMAGLVVNTMLMSAVLLQISRTDYTHVDTLLFGFIPLVGNILFRLRFPFALGMSLLCCVIMGVVLLQEPPSHVGLEFLALVIFVSATGLSLLANHQLERNQRHLWLLRLQERLRLKQTRSDGERLAQEASRDALTGLFNRRHFENHVMAHWERSSRAEEPPAVIMVDIDHFKGYNDACGHVQGDACLAAVADALQASLGLQPGMVVRFGGEEFLVWLESASVARVQACAERIRRNVRALKLPHPDSRVSDRVTVSVGAACHLPQRHARVMDLVREADDALYAAKHQGRDRCVMARQGE